MFSLHGSTQLRLWQVSRSRQSPLEEQPYSAGAAIVEEQRGRKLDYLTLYQKASFGTQDLLIFSQKTSPCPLKPSLQTQDMVLLGRVSKTLHSALATHGLISLQGFLQSGAKQACWLGHSPSAWHPLGGGGGTRKMDSNLQTGSYTTTLEEG